MKFKPFSALLMLLFAGLAFFAVRSCVNVKADRDRLRNNQNLLLHNGNVEISETASGRSRASAPALNLRPSEFRRGGDSLLKVARTAGIKPSRISDAATAATVTRADIIANLSSRQADDSASNLSTRLPVNSLTRMVRSLALHLRHRLRLPRPLFRIGFRHARYHCPPCSPPISLLPLRLSRGAHGHRQPQSPYPAHLRTVL